MPEPADPGRIGEVLIEEGVIFEEELQKALEGSAAGPVADALRSAGSASRERIAAILGGNYTIPRVNPVSVDVPRDVVDLIPPAVANKHEVVPIARFGGILCVAKANYFNRAALIEIRKLTGLKVKVLLCNETEIDEALEKWYGSGSSAARAAAPAAAPAAPPAPHSEPASPPVQPRRPQSAILEDERRPKGVRPLETAAEEIFVIEHVLQMQPMWEWEVTHCSRGPVKALATGS